MPDNDKKIVIERFPNSQWYKKHNVYYVTSETYPGFTIGSGSTFGEAWRIAREAVDEIIKKDMDHYEHNFNTGDFY